MKNVKCDKKENPKSYLLFRLIWVRGKDCRVRSRFLFFILRKSNGGDNKLVIS